MNNSSNSYCDDCPCYATQVAWEDYHVWYQTAMSCIGIVANLLILATLLAARISHSCHVYVLVLTLADLGYCLCTLVNFYYMRMPQGLMGLWQCRSVLTFYNLCKGIGNWVMVLLAADRLRVVVAPLRTHAKGRRIQCATSVTCGACLALLVVNLPRFFYLVEYQDLILDEVWLAPICSLLKTKVAQALRGVELAITFQIPVMTNACVNLVLCVCIWRMRIRRRRLSQQPVSNKSPSSATNVERQLTQMLVATSVLHSFFSLPIAWLEVVNLRESFLVTKNYFLYVCLYYSFGVFYSWHVFVNLPIYMVYNSAFRAQFWRLLLPYCFKRTQGESATGTQVTTSAFRQSETNL